MTKTERVASLNSSAPKLETMQSLIDMHKKIDNFQVLIEKLAQRVEGTATSYGEIMAQELAPTSVALAEIMSSAQGTVNEADQVLKKLISVLGQVSQVLKQLLEPKPVVKDHRLSVVIGLQALILLGMAAALLKYLLA